MTSRKPWRRWLLDQARLMGMERSVETLPASTVRLQYRHGPTALESIRQAALQFLAPHALSARTLYGVEIVFEEWLTNVARHGYASPGQAVVDIEICVGDTAVTLEFQDEGRAFEPLDAVAPAVPRSLDEARPGGLGLSMIRHVVSELHHHRRGSRNVLTVKVSRR